MLDFSNGAHISRIAHLAAGFKRQFQATDAVSGLAQASTTRSKRSD